MTSQITSSSSGPFRHRSLTLKKTYIHSIRKGSKTVEGRLFKGPAKNVQNGDRIRFYYYTNAKDDVVCKVTRVAKFPNFDAMVKEMGYRSCIPEASSEEEAIEMYSQIYPLEKQSAWGVVAFELTPSAEKSFS